MDYAGRYEDLQEAFGEDVLALWEHYQTNGASENREVRDEAVAQEEKAEEARRQQEAQKPQETPETSESEGRTERVEHTDDDGWDILEYDSAGRFLRNTTYKADGSVDGWMEYEYDSDGNRINSTYHKGTEEV